MSILSRLFPKLESGTPDAVDPSTAADAAPPVAPSPPPIPSPSPLTKAPGAPQTVTARMPFAVGDNKLVASTPNRRAREPRENRETTKEITKEITKDSGKDNLPAARNAPAATLPPPAAPARRGASTPRREKPPQEAPAPLLAADAVAAALTRTLAPHLPAAAGGAPELRPWSAADRAAARATFEDLATESIRPVRNLMLELGWGVTAGAWMVAARGALSSLRPMADQIEAVDISDAIGGFLAVLDQALEAGTIAPELGRQLVAAGGPLARALPRAFDLGA